MIEGINFSEILNHQENKKKYNELISNINIPRLESIFKDIAEKAGSPNPNFLSLEDMNASVEMINFPGMERYMNWSNRGFYFSQENKIFVNVQNTEKYAKESGRDLDFEFNHVVTHEQTHALARKSCAEPDDFDTGFIEYKKEYFLGERKNFTMYNEGVTEKLAREILMQYPTSEEEIQRYKENMERDPLTIGYEPYVKFVSLIIKQISSKVGVSEQIVWEGIKNSYIKGDNLYETSFKQAFEEDFYPGFVQDLGIMTDENDIEAIMKKMEKGESYNKTQKFFDDCSRFYKLIIEKYG